MLLLKDNILVLGWTQGQNLVGSRGGIQPKVSGCNQGQRTQNPCKVGQKRYQRKLSDSTAKNSSPVLRGSLGSPVLTCAVSSSDYVQVVAQLGLRGVLASFSVSHASHAMGACGSEPANVVSANLSSLSNLLLPSVSCSFFFWPVHLASVALSRAGGHSKRQGRESLSHQEEQWKKSWRSWIEQLG